MKLKILLQIALLLIVSVSVTQAATITDVRRNPFHRPTLTSVGDFRQMMAAEQQEIMQGMQQAGYPELYEPLMRQLPRARISRVTYSPGQSFIWMLSRSERTGQLQVISPMTWGGSAMLSAYEFTISSNGSQYVFAAPVVCGNLALKEIINVNAQSNVVEDQAWQAPNCDLPEEDCAKQQEQIAVEQKCPDCPRCPECKGHDCCLPFRLVADVGYMKQSDPADYLFARIGVEHSVTDRFSLLAMAGAAAQVGGDDGDDAFLLDFLVQYDWFRMFIGGGIGGWITSGDKNDDSADTDVDLIANIGTRLYGHPHSFNTSLFFEARSAIDELDSISEYGRFGAGLRCRF